MNSNDQIYLHCYNIKQIYVILHMIADFMAAFLFLIGSILFLYPQWIILGTWFFIIGSLLFGIKPTLKLIHFFHLKRLFKKLKVKEEFILKANNIHWDL